MARILIVEDDENLRYALQMILDTKYEVIIAATIGEATSALGKYKIDLVVLDLSLPDGSGFEFTAKMKSDDSTQRIPILILSGNTEISAKVAGFELGADDYILKPVNKDELHARIKSKLKFHSSPGPTLTQFGPFCVDEKRLKIFITREKPIEVDLSPMEFRLLVHFLNNEGKVFTRDQLISAIRGSGYAVTDRAIDTHIYSIRKKIGKDYGDIKTHYGSGYSFHLHP